MGFLKKNWCLLVLLLLFCLLAATLYDTYHISGRTELHSQEPVKSQNLKVGFSQIERDNPWRTAQINSLREALIPNNMEFIYHEPQEYTVKWQLQDIQELIRQRVNYLVIVPGDITSLSPALESAREAGIPVILIDQSAETIDKMYYMSLISADYRKEGELCAAMLAEKFNGKSCKIVEIYGTETSPGALARSRGFHQALKAYPNLQVIDVEYGNFDRVVAQKAMENALIKAANNGQSIDAVFAHSDEDGLGALQAVKAAGIDTKNISIVSINGIQDVCKAIIAGEYLGTVESNPRWGFIVEALIQQDRRGVQPFPTVLIPYKIITAENADSYLSTAY